MKKTRPRSLVPMAFSLKGHGNEVAKYDVRFFCFTRLSSTNALFPN